MITSLFIRRAGALLVLLLSVAPRVAEAVQVDVTATGVVEEITNAILSTEFSLGQTMSVTMTYDGSTPPDASLILTRALYMGAIEDGDFTVGSYVGTVFNGNINIEDDDPIFFDGITLRGFATGPAVGSLAARAFGISLDDPAAVAISDKSLPLDTSAISGFPERSWFLSFGASLGTTPPGVGGRITSVEITLRAGVPEPASALLLALAATTIGCLRRRRVT